MNTNISLAKAPLPNSAKINHPSQEGDMPSDIEVEIYSTLLFVVAGAVGTLLSIVSVMALDSYISYLF